eukprot:scaffold210101_cov37-Tisochrysis_lutea.AAC.1
MATTTNRYPPTLRVNCSLWPCCAHLMAQRSSVVRILRSLFVLRGATKAICTSQHAPYMRHTLHPRSRFCIPECKHSRSQTKRRA